MTELCPLEMEWPQFLWAEPECNGRHHALLCCNAFYFIFTTEAMGIAVYLESASSFSQADCCKGQLFHQAEKCRKRYISTDSTYIKHHTEASKADHIQRRYCCNGTKIPTRFSRTLQLERNFQLLFSNTMMLFNDFTAQMPRLRYVSLEASKGNVRSHTWLIFRVSRSSWDAGSSHCSSLLFSSSDAPDDAQGPGSKASSTSANRSQSMFTAFLASSWLHKEQSRAT